MFGQAMNPIIRADGSPRFAMISTLAGAAVNIVLDPIFIFVLKWGMMGAAVATVLGQAVMAVLAVLYLLNMKVVKPSKSDFKLCGTICGNHKLSLTNKPRCGYGSYQQYAQEIRSIGRDIFAGTVCADTDGSCGHSHEVLSDSYFNSCRHGGRLHTDRWLQYGS